MMIRTYPKCLQYNETEQALHNFYEYGNTPDDEDEAGWEQWWTEEEELAEKAPNYNYKWHLQGLFNDYCDSHDIQTYWKEVSYE